MNPPNQNSVQTPSTETPILNTATPTVPNIIEQQPAPDGKNKLIKIIAIGIAVFIILILLSLVLIRIFTKKNSTPIITETITQKGGTQITSYQLDDPDRKSLDTPCYTSLIPKSAKINASTQTGDACSIRIIMPDTTLPFVEIIAIKAGETLTTKEAAYSAKAAYDQEFKKADYSKYSTNVTENVDYGGLNSYLLDYFNGTYRYKAYFVDVPSNKGYIAVDKNVVGFFINGFAGDPTKDVFTKYFSEFSQNLKFK